MKRNRSFVSKAVVATATVATLATSAGLLAPVASADPNPAGPPPQKAGELVIGSGNLPGDMEYGGAVLSGAAAGWNAAWAALNRAAVTPPECKVLYAGLPIPKGTDTAQTSGTSRGAGWSMVVSKFTMDLAPLRAALPKCASFKAVRDGVTTEVGVRSITVAGAPDGLGLEFTAKSKRGNQVQYLQTRQYTAVVNGVTMSLRGGRETLAPAPFTAEDDQLASNLLAKQEAFLKNPPKPDAAPAAASESASAAPSAKPASAAPSAKPAPASSSAPKPAR